MALPTNVNYGTVVGQFLLAYADSADPDVFPDGIPAKGSIFFRPSPVKLLDGQSSPNPVTILPAVVECFLDVEGYLLGGDNTRGVRLVATDDPDLNPLNWTWTVEFRLTDQDDIPVPLPSFSIELPSDTTVDLTTVSPVPSANGTYYIVGPANTLAIGTVTSLDWTEPATATITGAAPNQTLSLGIPVGQPNSLDISTVTTSAPGSAAEATITGEAPSQTLSFVLPRGEIGPYPTLATDATQVSYDAPATATISSNEPTTNYKIDFQIPVGEPNTLAVGTVSTLPYTDSATVDITGNSPSQTINFGIPAGEPNQLSVGTVAASEPGGSPVVEITGSSPNQTINFVLPKGDTGPIGPIGPTGATGIEWQGTWDSLTDYVNNDAVFWNGASWFAAGDPPVGDEPSETSLYWFPLALQGATGPQGPSGTITVGTVTTLDPLSPAVVTNVGSSENAIFNFGIPKGDTGDIGNISAAAPITYQSNQIGLDYNALVIDGGSA